MHTSTSRYRFGIPRAEPGIATALSYLDVIAVTRPHATPGRPMTWPFTITDEQAMGRVQNADDPAAFARLVERRETPIQRLCARMTGDLHRVEDLAQEEA